MGKLPSKQPKNSLAGKKTPPPHPASREAFRRFSCFLHWRIILGAILAFHLLLAVLRFDPKVSIGGDDSWYIIAALDFWNGVAFPAWHGAFYPILISPLVATLGIHVPLLKVLSILFSLTAIAMLGYTLRERIPPFVWLFTLLLSAAAPQMVELVGSTYSEPLFMLLQAVILWLFVKLCDVKTSLLSRQTITLLLPLGLALFLLSLTRNVGYGALIAITIFLLAIRRDWKKTTAIIAAYMLFYIPFTIYKHVKWGINSASFTGQLSKIMLVNFYNPADGTETPAGLCLRVWENALQYLTEHLPAFLGIEVETPSVTLLLLIIAGGALIVLSKRTRTHFTWLLAIYLIVMLGGTFITQQTHWNQYRLVIVYLPLLLALFLYGIHAIFAHNAPHVGNIVIACLCGLSLLLTTTANFRKIDTLNLAKNLRGDQFAGLTPDWDSYLRVCQWAGKNLPDTVTIACRKPNNAQIYANRPFHGIFRYISDNADSVWDYFNTNRIDYLILGHLRVNPEKRTDRFINSLHFNAFRLLEGKPDCLELVYYKGDTEPAYLFRINRDAIYSTDPERYRQALESGLIIHPSNFDALHKIALLALKQKRANEALAYADQAIAIAKHMEINVPYPILEIRAMAIYLLGDPRQAATIFEQLATADPENPSHLYNLALCIKNSDPARAQKLLAKAKKIADKKI